MRTDTWKRAPWTRWSTCSRLSARLQGPSDLAAFPHFSCESSADLPVGCSSLQQNSRVGVAASHQATNKNKHVAGGSRAHRLSWPVLFAPIKHRQAVRALQECLRRLEPECQHHFHLGPCCCYSQSTAVQKDNVLSVGSEWHGGDDLELRRAQQRRHHFLVFCKRKSISLAATSGLQLIGTWLMCTQDGVAQKSTAATTLSCLALSPNGLFLAAGTPDQRLLLWNVSRPSYFTPERHLFIFTIFFCWCGKVNTGQLVTECEPHYQTVTAVAWTSDSQALVTASKDAQIKVFTLSACAQSHCSVCVSQC